MSYFEELLEKLNTQTTSQKKTKTTANKTKTTTKKKKKEETPFDEFLNETYGKFKTLAEANIDSNGKSTIFTTEGGGGRHFSSSGREHGGGSSAILTADEHNALLAEEEKKEREKREFLGLDIFQKGAWEGYEPGKVDSVGSFFDEMNEFNKRHAKASLGTIADVGLDILQGGLNMVEGIGDAAGYIVSGTHDLFGADEAAEKIKKDAQKETISTWLDPANKWLEQYSVFGDTTDAVSQGVGQVAATMGIGNIAQGLGATQKVATIITQIAQGSSAFGHGMSEAYKGGATDGEAVGYGILSAAAELFFEALTSGSSAEQASGHNTFSILKGIDDKLANKIGDLINNPQARNVVKGMVKGGFEGVEELLTGVAQGSAKLIYEDEKSWLELMKDENLWEQFFVGMLTGDIMQAGDVVKANKSGRDVITGLNADETTVVDKIVDERIEKKAKETKKDLTGKQKAEIREQVMEDLENGNLDVDDIERIIGGDSYNAFQEAVKGFEGNETYKEYQDALAEEKALQKEFDELSNAKATEATLGQNARFAELQQKLAELKQNSKSGELRTRLQPEIDRINQLKAKVREDSIGRLKDSKLTESYLELQRSNEKFKVDDFSKYKGEHSKQTINNILESGLMNNSNKMHKFVDFLAKISDAKGVTFSLTDAKKLAGTVHDMKGAVANAFVDGNKITLNMDSKKARQTVVGHEITHVLEGTEFYETLSNAVKRYAVSKGEWDTRLANITELYKKHAPNADPTKELVADLVGEYVFTDSKFVRNLSTEHRNVFQKIYDEIKWLCKIVTAGSEEARNLVEVKRIFDMVWKESNTKADTDTDVEETSDSETQYSISVTDPKKIDFLENQEHITTYKAMQLIDGKLYPPMAAKVKGEDGKYALQNPSQIGVWQEAVEDPSNIKFEKNGKGYYSLNKGNGKSVKAAYNPYEHSSNLVLNDQFEEAYQRDNIVTVECVIPASEMTSGYQAEHAKDATGMLDWKKGVVAGKLKDNQRKVYLSRWLKPVRILTDAETAKMYKDIVGDTAVPFNVVPPGLLKELENLGANIDYDGSPGYQYHHGKNNSTKYSISDSNGNQLSDAQQDFFKDSVVRDENGNLKVMYHGTSNGGHTVFDTYGGNHGLFGVGSYFTDSKTIGDSYTKKGRGKNPQVYETYLNIKNPIDMDAEANPAEWAEAFPEVDFPQSGTNEQFYRAVEEFCEDEMMYKWEAAEMIQSGIESGMGYDGITHIGGGRVNPNGEQHRVYIAFQPEQIKNTDNVNPTSDPDIRYSITEDNEGNTLTDAQQEFFKDTKAVDGNGKLLTVYHTTKNNFTVFDDARKGEATGGHNTYMGHFFTNDPDYMGNFPDFDGGKTDAYYLNMKNPIDMNNISREAFLDIVEVTGGDVDEAAELYDREYEAEVQMANFRGDNHVFPDFYNLIEELTGNFYDDAKFHDVLRPNYDKLLAKGYDGFINNMDGAGWANEYIVINSNQAKLTTNTNPTADADVRYSLSDEEGGIAQQINESLTMEEARQMIQRAFVLGGIKEWYDDQYKNGDEWIRGEGAEDVAMIIENEYSLQSAYIDRIPGLLNEDFYLTDVLEAYVAGTLTGKVKKATEKINLADGVTVADKRFYAPQEIENAKELYDVANQRLTNSNRDAVTKARAAILLFAHNKGAAETLGITNIELNKKLRTWGGYSASARDISMRINSGVNTSNRWSGIENVSWLSKATVSNDEVARLVKSVEGNGDGYQNSYIARTMLSLDTHIDWSWLNIKFDTYQGVNGGFNGNSPSGKCNGYYNNQNRLIHVKRDAPNTVAHEMGHALDYQWGRDLGYEHTCLTEISRTTQNISGEAKVWFGHFKEFADSLVASSDTRNEYSMNIKETFARFVSKFVEWTEQIGTGRSSGYESSFYNDKFTGAQFVQFARLLQEKSAIDAKGLTGNKFSITANEDVQDAGADSLAAGKYRNPSEVGFNPFGDDIAPVAEQNVQNTADVPFDAPVMNPAEQTFAPPANTLPPTEDNSFDAPVRADYEAIRPQQQKQPRMVRVDNQQNQQNQQTAQVLTEEKPKVKQKTNALHKAIEWFVDKGAVFERLSKKTKNRELEAKYNYLHYSEAKAQKFIGEGDADKGIRSLTSIAEQVGDRSEDFFSYLYHIHNMDRMTLRQRGFGEDKAVFGNHVSAQMSSAIAQQIETQNPDFRQLATEIYGINQHLRQMMVDGGIISQETANLWAKMYPHYVPIRRADYEAMAVNVPLDTNRTGVNAPVKRAMGGSSDISNLFNTMAQRVLQTYRAIDRNSFGTELMRTLGTVSENSATDMDGIMEGIDSHEELLQEGKNGNAPTFTVFVNGQRVKFNIDNEMYDAMKPTNEFFAGTNKFLNGMSNFRRGLITEYNPVFAVTNAIKDAQDVLMNSQHPLLTYANMPRAWAEMLGNGKWFKEYMANGGEQNTYFDKDSRSFKKEKSKLRKVVGFPLDAISAVNNFIERVPRLAEYIASREHGRSIEVAMLDAARVTTNFSAGGDVTKWANRNGFTFLNASVQGAAQQIRNVAEARMEGAKGWAKLAGKTIVAGLPALLLNGLLWDDDDEYEELSDYVKENYYIVGKFGDGQFVRIPKGRAVAVIQEAIRQVTEGDIDPAKFGELVISNLAPNDPLNNFVFAPIIQASTNKAWHGGEIVPQGMQDVPEAEQYDESTDSLSRWLGETFDISPMKANYVIDQYSGGVGDLLLPMMTPEAERGEDTIVGKIASPWIDKFTTDSVLNNQNVTDFYDLKDELTINANSVKATDNDLLMSSYMNSVNSQLNELYKEKREIQNSRMSDAKKFAEVRRVQQEIVDTMKNAMSTYENISYKRDTKTGEQYALIGDKVFVRYDGEYDHSWKILSKEQTEKYRITSSAGNANYATDGKTHYAWVVPDEDDVEKDPYWKKLTDKQIEKQNTVTRSLGITPEEYWSNRDEDSVKMYDWIYENPEKRTVAKAVTDDLKEYWEYKTHIGTIDAKDANGKTVNGLAKRRTHEYIFNLDLDDGQKMILFRSYYPKDDTYCYDIVDYLNNRNDITYRQMITILEELDMTVHADGTVTWD